jgi:transcriptional regulator with XRE-family HTH domain
MTITAAFGRTLRRLRLAQGLTQEQLGFEASLRRTYISSLELGEKDPSLRTISKLSLAFDIPISKLMNEVEREQKKL